MLHPDKAFSGFSVDDIAKAKAFYADVLGLENGERPNFSFPGAWMYSDGRAVVQVTERRRQRPCAHEKTPPARVVAVSHSCSPSPPQQSM